MFEWFVRRLRRARRDLLRPRVHGKRHDMHVQRPHRRMRGLRRREPALLPKLRVVRWRVCGSGNRLLERRHVRSMRRYGAAVLLWRCLLKRVSRLRGGARRSLWLLFVRHREPAMLRGRRVQHRFGLRRPAERRPGLRGMRRVGSALLRGRQVQRRAYVLVRRNLRALNRQQKRPGASSLDMVGRQIARPVPACRSGLRSKLLQLPFRSRAELVEQAGEERTQPWIVERAEVCGRVLQ